MQIYESNASYQGYGGGGGFNPVRVADQASAMEREFGKKRQRDQLYWKSLEQNDQTMIANADQNVKDVSAKVEDQLNALKGFSETIGNFVKDQAKQKITAEMEEATMQAWADPMQFSSEIDDFEKGEATLQKGQAIAERATADYEASGGSPIIGEQIRTRFTGLPQLAYEKARMQRAAVEYPGFHARYAAYIDGASTPEERAGRTAQVTQKFLRESGAMGMSPGLLNKYLFKGMRKYQIQEDTKWHAAQAAGIVEARKTELTDSLYLGLKSGNAGDAVWDYWQGRISQGVPSAKARKELGQFLLDNEGILTPDDIQELKDKTITWNDGSERKLGKVLAREIDALELQVADNVGRDLELSQTQLDTRRKQFKLKFDQMTAGLTEPLTNEQIKQLEADYRADGLGDPGSLFKDYVTSEEQDVNQAVAELQAKMDAEGFITPSDIAGMPLAVRNSKEVQKMLTDGSPLAGMDPEAFKNRMKGIANDATGLNADQRNTGTYYRTLDNVQREGRKLMAQALKSGRYTNPDGTTDYARALDDVEAQMQAKITANPEVYSTPGQSQPTSVSGYQNRLQELNRVMRADPTSIQTSQIYSTEQDLSQAQKFIMTGEGNFPPVYNDLARSQKNVTAYDIAMAQLELAGVKVNPPAIEEDVKKQDAAVQELLNFHNTPNRTERAFTPDMNAPEVVSTNKNLKDYERTALNVIGKYESDSVGGYNAVNQIGVAGGRGVMGFSGDYKKLGGKNLTSMTLGEIMSLQARRPGMSNAEWIRQGRLHAVGRYQFIGPTLAAEVKRLGLSPDTKFTPAVQDTIALSHMRRNGITPWVGPSDYATAAERAAVRRVMRS